MTSTYDLFFKPERSLSNYEKPVDITLSPDLIRDFLNCDWEIIACFRVPLTRMGTDTETQPKFLLVLPQ